MALRPDCQHAKTLSSSLPPSVCMAIIAVSPIISRSWCKGLLATFGLLYSRHPQMKGHSADLPFRRVLPIAQLLICVIVLWPSRYFLLWQVSQSVREYLPARAQQQQSGPTINIEIPSLTPEQQKTADRAARMEDLRMAVAPMLNLPVGIIQLPYALAHSTPEGKEWIPRGMMFTTWRALSWPIFGVFFWWLAGRGIDALRAARKSILVPRITIPETIFAVIFLGIGVVAIVGILTSTPDDRRDVNFLAFLAGGFLWGIIAALMIAARFLQWRLKKRATPPALA